MEDKKQVKYVRMTPFNLYKDYKDDAGNSDYGLLSWSMRDDVPRISIHTVNKNRKDKNKIDWDTTITAPLPMLLYKMFSDLFKEVIASKEECKHSIDCVNTKFVNNKRTDEVELQAKIVFGRDSAGVIYLSALSGSKRKLKFDLIHDSKWHMFYGKDGKLIEDKTVLSSMYANAYIQSLDAVIEKYLEEKVLRENANNPTYAQDNTKKSYQPSNTNAQPPKVVDDVKEDNEIDINDLI